MSSYGWALVLVAVNLKVLEGLAVK